MRVRFKVGLFTNKNNNKKLISTKQYSSSSSHKEMYYLYLYLLQIVFTIAYIEINKHDFIESCSPYSYFVLCSYRQAHKGS